MWLFVVNYLMLASGLLGNTSVYRTPILAVSFALMLFFVLQWIKKKGRIGSTGPIKIASGVVLVITLILGGLINKPIGGTLVGIGGFLGNNTLIEAGESFGADISTTRGDAAGTAETRKIFWQSIIDYQFDNVKSLTFGYGLQDGFMDVTLPDMPFNNKELVDPHNSFINIFFRFGLIGLFLYVWAIIRMARYVISVVSLQKALPFISIAIIFASFEVALENPHGALIFWLIFLLPLMFEKPPDGLASNNKVGRANSLYP